VALPLSEIMVSRKAYSEDADRARGRFGGLGQSGYAIFELGLGDNRKEVSWNNYYVRYGRMATCDSRMRRRLAGVEVESVNCRVVPEFFLRVRERFREDGAVGEESEM